MCWRIDDTREWTREARTHTHTRACKDEEGELVTELEVIESVGQLHTYDNESLAPCMIYKQAIVSLRRTRRDYG